MVQDSISTDILCCFQLSIEKQSGHSKVHRADCNNLQTLLALAMLCNQATLPAKDRIAPAPSSQLMWGKACLPLHCGNIGMAISVKCSSGRKYRSFARAASLSASLSLAGLSITHNFPFLSKVGQNTPQTGILAGFCSKLQTAALSPAANASVILGRERYCCSQQACAPPKNTPSQNWKTGFEWWWMGSKLQTVAKRRWHRHSALHAMELKETKWHLTFVTLNWRLNV